MYNDTKLLTIISQGESDNVEFTQSAKDLDKIREAICAFANDLPDHREPGFIFIGIKDDGSYADLAIDDKLLQTLGGLRDDGKILPFPMMEVSRRLLNDHEVAVVQVEPSVNPPVKSDGRCWIRTGPRRSQATAEDERRLTEKRHWGSLTYDMQGVAGASVEHDLDLRKFEVEYLPNAVSQEVLEGNKRNLKEQLQALRLTSEDGTPTVTAILMLGKFPASWFPGAYIQFVRYDGDKVTDPVKSQREIHGTLSDQLTEIEKIFNTNIAVALDAGREIHVETPDYPVVALRELIRNAVIHRNYNGTNTPIRFHWFENKIEIISPGSVYGVVTRENFGSPGITDYRNPTIAEAMKNMGYMERFGTGIDKARRALEENSNPAPKLTAEDTFIFVEIRKS